MIVNVVPLLMTLLSTQASKLKQTADAALATTTSGREHEQWKARDFCCVRDQDALDLICKNTFGGGDYVPKMSTTFAKDPNCHFQVLTHAERQDTCAAVANMRRLNANMAWFEAVRTSEHYRNKGLAHRLLQSMLHDAVDMGYTQVLSCTVASNKPMRKVFDKLQMKELTRIHMTKFDVLRNLPGWAATDEKPCRQHLMASLDVEHLVSQSARESKWCIVESKTELQRILRDIQSKGGCGLMPGIYEVIDGHPLQESLDEELVLSLRDGDDRHQAVMVLLRDKRISSLKSNWSLSLAGTHDQHLQAALWHACSPEIQSRLTSGTTDEVAGFTLAFEGVIPSDGPMCSALPLTKDTAFVYGTCLNGDDPTKTD